ncbi:hypothetical protein C8R48DRAFT_172816 [Suillus tomentosus]|nr:hypothetical protein C8R48DRAFT_172816 [Suillus tomentosus]
MGQAQVQPFVTASLLWWLLASQPCSPTGGHKNCGRPDAPVFLGSRRAQLSSYGIKILWQFRVIGLFLEHMQHIAAHAYAKLLRDPSRAGLNLHTMSREHTGRAVCPGALACQNAITSCSSS